MSSTILGLIPALGLLGLLILHLARQTTPFNPSLSFISRATNLVLILGIFYLAWLGFERGHIPPLGTSELFQAVGILGVGVYLLFSRKASFPVKAVVPGWLLLALSFSGGLYLTWNKEVYQGLTPLWIWALLGKWLILWAGGCLIWLVSLSMATWVDSLRQRAANRSDSPLPATETGFIDQLQRHILITLFSGSLLLLAHSWWGWGKQAYWLMGMFGSWVFICGSWWTRFTWPHRLWWMWTLNLLGFVAFIISLVAIIRF